jgi:release factor glutamine methyltransferase
LPSIQDIIEKSTQYLKNRSFVDSARLESEMLLSFILGCKRIDLYLQHDRPLTEKELEEMRALLKKRGTGYPMAYLLGVKGFYRSDFKVTPATLIPRPETEILVEKAVEYVQNLSEQDRKNFSICDMGAGCGAIGLSLAQELVSSSVTLVEACPKALAVCEENAFRLGVRERVRLVEERISPESFSFLKSSEKTLFSMIVGNPPYIDEKDSAVEPWVRQYEPSMALFSEEKGLKDLNLWIRIAKKHVIPGGVMLFEHGHTQGTFVQKIMKEQGCVHTEPLYDLSHHWRHTLGVLD